MQALLRLGLASSLTFRKVRQRGLNACSELFILM